MSRLFNGTSDFLEVTGQSAFIGSSPFTVSVWVKPSSFSTNAVAVGYGTASPHSEYWCLFTNTSGTGLLERSVSSSTDTTGGTLSTGSWQHMAAVVSSDASALIYVNGVAGTADTTAQTLANQSVISVGRVVISGTGLDFYAGQIAEVAIWNTALTGTQVGNLFNAGSGIGTNPINTSVANLVGYWRIQGTASPEPSYTGSFGPSLTVTGTTPELGDDPPVQSTGAHTSSLTGGLSFAGNQNKTTFQSMMSNLLLGIQNVFVNLNGSLSFSGSTPHLINRLSTASVSFTGQALKTLVRFYAAVLSFVGAISTLHNTTGLQSITLSSTLSFTGNAVHNISALLIGALTSSGRIIRGRILSAALSFAGLTRRSTGQLLTGALSFAGQAQKRLAKTLAAASMTLNGLVTTYVPPKLMLMISSLSFAGSIQRGIRKQLPAALPFSGSLTRFIRHLWTAALGLAGSFNASSNNLLHQVFVATLSPTGSMFKLSNRTLRATLGLTTSMAKSAQRAVTASVGFVGNKSVAMTRLMQSSLLFVGSMTASSGRSVLVSLAASLSSTGSVQRMTRATRIAGLAFHGAIARTTSYLVVAALSMAGSVRHGSIVHVLRSGLSFTGNSARGLRRSLNASLSFGGRMIKSLVRFFGGILSTQGASTRTYIQGPPVAPPVTPPVASSTTLTWTPNTSTLVAYDDSDYLAHLDEAELVMDESGDAPIVPPEPPFDPSRMK